MPLTGAHHAFTCEHYEPPAVLTGKGQVAGAAVCENTDDGTTSLALDYALVKGLARTPPRSAKEEHDLASSDGSRLSLRATLHYLLDEGGLTRWSPQFKGTRTWAAARHAILTVASAARAKGSPLTDLLFMPEPFSVLEVRESAIRRQRALSRLAISPSNRMLAIGEVKSLERARFGHRLLLKHLPDLPLHVTEELYKRVAARFLRQFTMWGQFDDTRLLLCGTISQPVPGVLALEEASFVNVNRAWIPFESAQEYELLQRLSLRQYTKTLRYNLPRSVPVASAILHDCAPNVALFLLEPGSAEEGRQRTASLATDAAMGTWYWDLAEDLMPDLPPPNNDLE
jgi:hypothetical protein